MIMDTTNLNERLNLALLESVLVSYFTPTFLHVSKPDDDNDIHVILSSPQFNYLTTQERIKEVMTCIMSNIPDAYKDRLIIVQAYTTNEFEDVIDYILEEEETNGVR